MKVQALWRSRGSGALWNSASSAAHSSGWPQPPRRPDSLPCPPPASLASALPLSVRRPAPLPLSCGAMAYRASARIRRPLRRHRKAVEDMPAERVTVGQTRMIEILGWVAPHAEPLHDRLRAPVRHRREGDDGGKAERPEPVGDDQPRRLGRIAVTPVIERKPPTDLDAGREMRREARDREPDEADERGNARHLDGPETEAMLRKMRLETVDQRIALTAVGVSGEELHDAGIGIEGGERRPIGIAPAAQPDPTAWRRRRIPDDRDHP